ALALAGQALGRVSPNPAVGAVLVRDGQVVGEGFTRPPGGPHAEVVALEQAGEAARGSTLYTSLEPCCHQGLTPPCTKAIIAAGVAEVHMAILDPDPNVSGRGRQELEAAGIAVLVGECEQEARRLNEAYIKHRTTGLPFVIAKFAASLDGRIAAASGDSRWISGPQSRQWAHEQRATLDAIMVGVNTILVDNPQLTARPGSQDSERQPLRVVADSQGRTPASARVLQGPGQALIATSDRSDPSWRQAMEAAGAEVLVLPRDGDSIDLAALLRALAERGVLSLLVEGGGILLGSLFDQGLVDKVQAIIAPLIIGAAEAPSAVAGRGAQRLADAWRLREVTVERLGDDILIIGYPTKRGE
ncbi:MAG: bifunctional diaminohydroxyphosphoribosylaminopyrimidine deaminase/5-amino-6-(5-phosphoribosylamino)uracil reductase RibD, partial [Dehalococcoidia bacterium]|nr:bifunctional diaminohydroxyphosphoribosylaminopyrimidine deaminase/5-amino-6-(5-phosphoribosylamino)uracil reductase RibD [Dehalococcoidia bacterium]